MRVGLVQLTSSDDPARNLENSSKLIRCAAEKGARFVLTPEVANCVSMDRAHQQSVLTDETGDDFLAGYRALALELGIWLLAGSVALKTDEGDDRFSNRSVLIAPDGSVSARYDKIHMFDVDLSEGEGYRESAGFRPGTRAIVTKVDDVSLGMTICYDMRFPALYRTLAHAGAQIISVPAAFTRPTGAAHWETLLRARAIENGVFILAPAQTGHHRAAAGKERETWGHSLVVSPWGEVLLDMGEEEGFSVCDLNMDDVSKARRRIPSLLHDRNFELQK